ncbi:Carboxymuconolactone decarboxylase family protein [Novipirellula galeiformis]|uniref:Carboxymuconolactone decarboxylase family protein n=1 Tax=Novipirellula galeiformis TaxID=2528004 RepID=A0A5C6CL40_9BACT|nr:carboxymuconolactone decarboxylase family protein [Novipirellula galeiformis]TWU25320.1 Carboxymuconolactone decarboxylase family protein [Novipirellula galeiformis]
MPSHLPPLIEAEARECELIFRMARQQLGFVPNSMLTMARQPAVLGSFAMLVANILGPPRDRGLPVWTGVRLYLKNIIWSIRHLRSADRLSASLKSLVAHVSSNASGCRYCQAHTIGEAFHLGISIEKLEAVWDFENSDLFDAAEVAALRFALAAGSTPSAVTRDHFTTLRLHYSENQIVELGATIALFGFLNRWNDTFATTLEPDSAAFAQKHLGGSGWEIGKHA